MFGILPTDDGGRTELHKVNVTPLIFLQLLENIEKGRLKDLTTSQVQLAFKKYLSETKGPWKASDYDDISKLEKLASAHVKDMLAEYKTRSAADQKNGTTPSPSEHAKKQSALLKELGLLPPDDKDLPTSLQGKELSNDQQATNLIKTAETASTMLDAISMAGEPTAAVTATVLVIAIESNLAHKAIEALLGVYDNAAKNTSEKELILNTVKHESAHLDRAPLVEPLKKIQRNETNYTYVEKIQEIKPVADKTVKVEFKDNSTMTQIPVFTAGTVTNNKIKTPFDLPTLDDWKSGPKGPTSTIHQDKRTSDQT